MSHEGTPLCTEGGACARLRPGRHETEVLLDAGGTDHERAAVLAHALDHVGAVPFSVWVDQPGGHFDDIAARHGFEPVIHTSRQVELLAEQGPAALNVWLKFDTGMHRLGFQPRQARELVAEIGAMPSVRELRLMTHLAFADEPGHPQTEQQLKRFETVVANYDGAISIANSAAILGTADIARARERFGFAGEHWIRPGIALYGISPLAAQSAAELGLEPVMQLEARLIATKPLAAGDSVGYR
ncbi:MAG: alanine racemase, partial [Actinomycetota bacterium]